MARVVFTEQQFKDYMRMVLNEEKKNDFTKRILKEAFEESDAYKEQSEREIEVFIDGLENGSAMVDDTSAAVPYPEDDEYGNEEPSRWVVYEFSNPGYLRDDGFSIQHVKIDGATERHIKNTIYNNYGITVPDDEDSYM